MHPKDEVLQDHRVWILNPLNKKPFTRFYEDSIYRIKVRNDNPVKIKITAFNENFEIRHEDTLATLRTGRALENWSDSKIEIGFLVDTVQNILIYHYKSTNPGDSSKIDERIFRTDTLGAYKYQLHKKSR